jgi:DNA-binding MarR family transcriptional regulator
MNDKINGFVQIPKAIAYDPKISFAAKSVYMILVGHCFDKDTCFPGIGRISTILGCSKPTVIKAIKELQENNYVVKHRRGNGVSNVYEVKNIYQ